MNRHPAACRPSVSPLIDQPTRLTRSWQVYTVKNIRISPTDILRRVLHILTERRFSIRSCPAQAQVHVAIDGYERIRNRTRRELSVNKRIFLQCTPPPHSSGMRTVDLHTHTHTHTHTHAHLCLAVAVGDAENFVQREQCAATNCDRGLDTAAASQLVRRCRFFSKPFLLHAFT